MHEDLFTENGMTLCRLVTMDNEALADLFIQLLKGEGIHAIRRFTGPGAIAEIYGCSSNNYFVDIYVLEEQMEHAQEILAAYNAPGSTVE